jgi:membrane-associated HD superfamily phosphohydrolase
MDKMINEWNLNELLGFIKENNIESLLKSSDGRIDFTDDIFQQIDDLKRIADRTTEKTKDYIKNIDKVKLEDQLRPIIKYLKDIQNLEYDPSQAEKNQKQPFYNFFTINTGPNPNDDKDFDKRLNFIKSTISQALFLELSDFIKSNEFKNSVDEIAAAKNEAKEALNDIENIKIAGQEEIAKKGISLHADIFNNQANEIHKKNSVKWIRTGIIVLSIILSLIVFGGLYVIYHFNDTESLDKIEFAVMIGLLVSYLSYFLVQIFKNYFAEKHNQQINQHRANCLGTYNTFANSADGEIKKEILLYATHTIFSHQKTGYLANEVDNSNPNPIYEVVKNVTKVDTK